MARRLVLCLAVCVLAGVLGAPANAAPYRPSLPDVLLTQHFAIHFNGDPKAADYATQVKAGELGGYLEQAYAAITGLGLAPPVDDVIDTPGRLDYYIADLSTDGFTTEVFPDGSVPTSAAVDFAISELGAADEAQQAAFTVAELVEYRHWDPPFADDWAWYGSAQWLGVKAVGYPGSAFTKLGPPNISLDCADSNPSLQQCDPLWATAKGFTRWTFFEFLAQRFGPSFVTAVYDQQQSSGSTTVAALQAALGAKGTTFDDAFHDWSVKEMVGGWGIAALDAVNVPIAQSITTGATTSSLGSNTFFVDHLATKYLAFTRGDGLGDHPCFAATLTINVVAPAGVNARPVFWWNQAGSTPVALTANGTTWSAAIPWDTCNWPANKGLLSLTNPSTTTNAAQFVVSSSLTVDPNTPAAPTTAPAPQPVSGPVVPVSNADVPPGITLFGPLLLQVSAANPQLRLIVESTGEGKVHAQLGSVDLGSPAVRAGNNDLRFTIPKSLLSTLRTKAAAGNVLTLTPLSTSGAVSGTAVTRDVKVAAAPKAKKKKH